jgi:hypothetical protein
VRSIGPQTKSDVPCTLAAQSHPLIEFVGDLEGFIKQCQAMMAKSKSAGVERFEDGSRPM